MHGSRLCALFILPALLTLSPTTGAQSVISTRSGLIHFFEGTVYLGDQPLEEHFGRFPAIPPGGELRTEIGRAEVLLTPGVFLRVGQQSSIRMVNNDLQDTQVELRTGGAILDSGESNSAAPETPVYPVTLIYKDWRVHVLRKGIYRIDSDPPRLWVRRGQADVSAGPSGVPVSVEEGMTLPLAQVLVPERSLVEPGDAFADWSDGRSQSIAADNTITQQIDEDPASRASDPDTFTYFPYIGVPDPVTVSSYPYSVYNPYQPGFHSMYLPGYTYRPLIFGFTGTAIRPYTLSRPGRIYVSPGAVGSGPSVRAPLPRPAPVRAAPLHMSVPRVGAHR